eukprot:CAMPEP_0119480108 /NCGR_PEP_ID=MMETSP1344-20130328/9067_1 /TAXON_ID=236787 /ORGANISM="Florenciella parvula, Strain CCMP2471" /LENGTH=80 /DNA_ID=CAMNT_0007514391 /DNA_START=432 /DNA_END=675 /DNA_ORIENTATION=-
MNLGLSATSDTGSGGRPAASVATPPPVQAMEYGVSALPSTRGAVAPRGACHHAARHGAPTNGAASPLVRAVLPASAVQVT